VTPDKQRGKALYQASILEWLRVISYMFGVGFEILFKEFTRRHGERAHASRPQRAKVVTPEKCVENMHTKVKRAPLGKKSVWHSHRACGLRGPRSVMWVGNRCQQHTFDSFLSQLLHDSSLVSCVSPRDNWCIHGNV